MFPTAILRALAFAAAVAGSALPAAAAVDVDVGSTAGAPTFQRALPDFSDLSDEGTDVAYDVFSFSVGATGTYRIRSFAAGLRQGAPWDQMLFLYTGSFDPLAPLVNGVAANDNFLGISGLSGMNVGLTIGTSYFLVTTGHGNEDEGGFLSLIRGPGAILPVIPEPGTYALLALGLAAVTLAARRRAPNLEH